MTFADDICGLQNRFAKIAKLQLQIQRPIRKLEDHNGFTRF